MPTSYVTPTETSTTTVAGDENMITETVTEKETQVITKRSTLTQGESQETSGEVSVTTTGNSETTSNAGGSGEGGVINVTASASQTGAGRKLPANIGIGEVALAIVFTWVV